MAFRLNFYDNNSRKIYKAIIETLSKSASGIDTALLLSYANLQSMEEELLRKVKEEGFTVTNTNSRGGKVQTTSPLYRTYLQTVSEKSKVYAKVSKLLPDNLDDEGDDFDRF